MPALAKQVLFRGDMAVECECDVILREQQEVDKQLEEVVFDHLHAVAFQGLCFFSIYFLLLNDIILWVNHWEGPFLGQKKISLRLNLMT
jgi:hypothetical protein